jgi:hypothetical protein
MQCSSRHKGLRCEREEHNEGKHEALSPDEGSLVTWTDAEADAARVKLEPPRRAG